MTPPADDYSFPLGYLRPGDATPRMTPAQAAELLSLSKRLSRRGIGNQECEPAVIVAFFRNGGLVKYVANADEAADTIAAMREALTKLEPPDPLSKCPHVGVVRACSYRVGGRCQRTDRKRSRIPTGEPPP